MQHSTNAFRLSSCRGMGAYSMKTFDSIRFPACLCVYEEEGEHCA